VLSILLALTPSALALTPENLVLVTNKNVPESKQLAEYYAKRRSLPEGRILELNLPATDEISFADYETLVLPPTREFLAKPELANKITCLVTFYGVPLKIAARITTPEETAEAQRLKQELDAIPAQLEPLVQKVEALAKQADPSFTPAAGQTIGDLSARTEAASRKLAARIAKIEDPGAREQLSTFIQETLRPLVGPAMVAQNRMHDLSRIQNLTPEQVATGTRIKDSLLAMRARFESLHAHRIDPDAREQLRTLVKEELGPFEYARTLQGMLDYFGSDSSDAAFDSELALVTWNLYPRARSLGNPLHHHPTVKAAPPTYMTCRLDGPQPASARDIIIASLKAEADGLTGKIVLDAGGHLALNPNVPSYAAYDHKFTELRDLLGQKTKLPIVFDAQKEILPPNSVQNAALYCGWYQLRNYTPSCSFAPGAVAYHIASFEMATLHAPGEKGWCAGLLADGAAVTIGPVNEPFLSAFPRPDEFFPLLLTGQLTLAEAYWKTVPHVSWRMALIADPLYTPYKKNPPLKPSDLPEPLQQIFQKPTPPQPPAISSPR
jgi:uncharacterized protein (TIGR03790 family)